MKQLAFITQGHSDYEDRLRQILDASGIDPHEFEGLDYFGLTPFFVIAGATVRPDVHAHGDHSHTTGVYLEIPEELEEAFYGTLPPLLESAYGTTD